MNDGNFRALLRFRCNSGDTVLKHHLQTAAKNATYISPQVQNEIIDACGRIITKEIVTAINASKAFSVLADETTDVANIEQFSLCFRYYDAKVQRVREDFLCFVPVIDVTGKSLAETLMQSMQNLGINTERLVGQGYDGAKAMSGRFNGAQKHVQDKHEHAIYVHCAAHSLNLAISDACGVPCIRNCMGTLSSICSFFNTPKRQSVLTRNIDLLEEDVRATKLKKLCPTRWVQRHESVLVYLDLQSATIASLEEIAEWDDKTTASLAHQLAVAVKSIEFQCAIRSMAVVFSVTLPLSRILQTESADLQLAMNCVTTVEAELQNIRTNANAEFAKEFTNVSKFCDDLGIPVNIPRRFSQKKNANQTSPETTPEMHFRVAVFLPFVDSALMQLQMRLLQHRELLLGFSCLQKYDKVEWTSDDEDNAINLFNRYEKLIHCSKSEAVAEIKLWRRHMATVCKPNNLQEAIQKSDVVMFATVRVLLEIFAALPVTTSAVERSFSSLRLLKTYLRNALTENRLNGLALLSIHRDIAVCPEAVLNLLATEQRRLQMRLK